MASPLLAVVDERSGIQVMMGLVAKVILHRKCHALRNVPLNTGSSPSPSNLALFRLFSPFAFAAAARFSWASLSSPRTDALGVGGASGFAGARNVCFCRDVTGEDLNVCTRYLYTHSVLAHEATLTDGFRLEDIAVVNDYALHRLGCISSGLLLLMRHDLCMEF